jgi:DNA mismatch repair protein MutS
MQKYLEFKAENPDAIIFYRLGDFYEMFFEDAELVASKIGLTLTSKQCGLAKPAPMCGVPFHSSTIYIKKLVDMGYKIAIAEQMEEANGKTLIKREVVRIITQGTVIDDTMLCADTNNFLSAVYEGQYCAYCDITTGEFYCLEIPADNLIAKINPREIITQDKYDYAFKPKFARETVLNYFNILTTTIFNIDDNSPLVCACGALLEFLSITQKGGKLSNITKITRLKRGDSLELDRVAIENLEILKTYRENKKHGSLLGVMDRTLTPMGARRMAAVVSSPLRSVEDIMERQIYVKELVEDAALLKNIRDILAKFNDLSRFAGKLSNGNILPKDLIAFANCLEHIKELRMTVDTRKFPLHDLNDIKVFLKGAIEPESRVGMGGGGYILDGFNAELDALRKSSVLGKDWLSKLEQITRDKMNIEKMKLAFSRLSGYYFEIPAKDVSRIPFDFIRKGSTVNTERFTTKELQDIETKILGAEEKAAVLEKKLFTEIINTVKSKINEIKINADSIAEIDTLCAIAFVSYKNEWVAPSLNTDGVLMLKEAKHPVLSSTENNFVGNDCNLDTENTAILITGPNMAGKSTFMKTIALNIILAQIGSFVPCSFAKIAITDKIFTRIGASDDMQTGQSTFMVEMNEVSNIVHNATNNSLVLLDEIGRGTGTADGFALAKSIMQYITAKICCKTIMATHFHNLVEMAEENHHIKNYKVLARKIGDEFVFLHKVVEGIEPDSLGIEVAKLSGLPVEILDNARQILKEEKTKEKRNGAN